MGNLLFSPSGRIGPGQFMSGVKILVIIAVVLAILPAFVPALVMLNILGLVMLWCWVVLWVKRYHDGGKSGWMCLIPIIIYIILSLIVSTILAGMLVDTEAIAAITEAQEQADLGALMSMMGKGGMTTTGLIVTALAGAAVSYIIAMVFNNMIKHDAHDNQFGPEAGTS